MKAIVCIICFLGFAILNSQAKTNLCKPEVVEASKRMLTEICPLRKTTKFSMEEVYACKVRKGYRIKDGIMECAEKHFENASYADPVISKKIGCDDSNPALAEEFACCWMSTQTNDKLSGDDIINFCKGCYMDANA